ncbi:Ribosomal RNA small subunit methyltransferase F [Vibrio nigripulchritudo SFn27]|uniref:Ribosomal RNA small subunit methyltransferase F n=1 Tax=Vibrio nigripulchritudo TaxID=28173 RepID=U4K5G2_9VIBR|nr:16S rRNA (cytosine(1407)-C(5))-methyltransferase RsmF [Vibrio nigripulchritudo]CCN34071.1 Ribosomal RNA small subunit methyltransferase F [Vibrio nigripulchritudo AM115]CCN40514.1 Ribosomal RNA small subunit methyltransferase F [Vibrio nigripulchritudo FTn2]CCN63640.1 Ribosomal RNA small subunit methyltransferase F [Vibrio nigripulchritudo POn4]CCN77599.1 Ribosomal RNA small subunit methyltransferase F [Vibrio nigripulchritudo SO65]CCN84092.1 Ribosomal RNA small subunit methyltransferase F 
MHSNIKLPDAFISQIQDIMPSHLDMDEFIAACKRPLRRSIRVNTLKISVEDFLGRAEAKGWTLTPVPWCDTGFWIEREETDTVPLGNTAEHMAGLFYIQEASSMMPVTALLADNDVDALNTVLDVAAAPGSKTTQIAAALNNRGALVANEFSASRIKGLYSNIQRCGVRNVALTNFDGRVFGGWLPEQFDAILLDAPCSGEGTIRKDPDAMNNWSKESVLDIAHTQKDLIESAFYALKPGGVLVYSTCTLNLEENQQVCHHLKEKFGDAVDFEPLNGLFENAENAITEDGFLHIYPQIFDSEGFFVARLRKHHSVESPEVKKRLGKFPFDKASKKVSQDVEKHLTETLGISLPDQTQLWLRDKEVWLFPTALESMIGEIRFDRMGIKLAEAHKKGYRWQHEAIMALSTGEETQSISLNIEDAREWFMGRDVRPENLSGKGEVIVKFGEDVIGIGKWVGNRIKNGLPRELVRDGNLF